MDSKELTLDCVQLNYQNLDNKRIKPITIRLPYIEPRPSAAPAHRLSNGVMVIMMSRLRRFHDARARRR